MRFILTKELGRLAKWLRILGFDAAYFKDNNTSSLIIAALRDERVILTRNLRIARLRGIKVLSIQAQEVKPQIQEVFSLTGFQFNPQMMFTRCILCNEELADITKEKVEGNVPAYVYATQQNFVACPKCQRIYWQGTHWGNVRRCLEEIEGNA